ncbi:Gfo/Idh/MocA family oxidoreductase [Lachnospiraceae bacterium OttesenSCG-928-D06]|nr:Gfo/Idh/MocA family oxidoreductase [Lachnospiraceae bacterium OttesenSCG-928-D06]
MRVGLVGCGSIAQVHAMILSKAENVDFVCMADTNFQAAKEMADTYGGKPYSSLSAMLMEEEIDVLHICTPHALHTPMIALAAEKGIQVFTEKPPVIDRKQWDILKKAGQKVPIGICFQNRYNGNVKRVKELLEANTLGAFLGARGIVTWNRPQNYYTDNSWRGSMEMEGGGALINQAIHTLDLLIHFLGRPNSIIADAKQFHLKPPVEVEDSLTARIMYGEKPVVFYATTGNCIDSPVLIDLYFEQGSIRMENNNVVIKYQDGTEEKQEYIEPKSLGKSYWGHGHESCILDFYAKMEEKKAAPIGIQEVEDTVDALLSIYESAAKGEEIIL